MGALSDKVLPVLKVLLVLHGLIVPPVLELSILHSPFVSIFLLTVFDERHKAGWKHGGSCIGRKTSWSHATERLIPCSLRETGNFFTKPWFLQKVPGLHAPRACVASPRTLRAKDPSLEGSTASAET